ncbi:MAG TPA: hypothetical protein VFV08_13455, partial [Puia sp.]|nr:hypothetical protein [Puia sp.]
ADASTSTVAKKDDMSNSNASAKEVAANTNSAKPDNGSSNSTSTTPKTSNGPNSTTVKKDDVSGSTSVKKADATGGTTAGATVAAVAATNKEEKNVAVDSSQGKDVFMAPARVNTSLVSTTPVIKPDILKITDQFKKRKQLLGKVIEVASDSIRLSFYDNAEIDGDSISVFLNGQLIMAHQELTERAFNVYVKLDSLKEINEVSMFAENLGKYPPNTALMVVSDGDRRYEVFMSSDLKGNATVRFKRKRSEGQLASEQ